MIGNEVGVVAVNIRASDKYPAAKGGAGAPAPAHNNLLQGCSN